MLSSMTLSLHSNNNNNDSDGPDGIGQHSYVLLSVCPDGGFCMASSALTYFKIFIIFFFLRVFFTKDLETAADSIYNHDNHSGRETESGC